MNKIAVIVGHTVKGQDKGAVAYNGVTESEYNFKIARYLKEKLFGHGILCDIYTKDNHTFQQISQFIKEKKYELSIELHFNSFHKEAYGCECLALVGDDKSIQFADLLTDKVAKAFSVKQRDEDGVVLIAKGGRGYKNLKIIKDNNPEIIAVLSEPFFGNTDTPESRKFMENPMMYVEAIVETIIQFKVKEQTKEHTKISPSGIVEKVIGIMKPQYGNPK